MIQPERQNELTPLVEPQVQLRAF